MYLLKLFGSGKTLCVSKHSHSTMYLLKRYLCKSCICTVQKFTFHHVSIKTTIREMKGRFLNNSHSTMYLLKQDISSETFDKGSLFTFHHVSIKTLLQVRKNKIYIIFTFHHVSIKTLFVEASPTCGTNSHSTMYLLKPKSPFYNKPMVLNSHSTMYLLKLDKPSSSTHEKAIHIPPCIY